MPIPVTCPSCGTILAAPESAAGKRAKCRTCQTIITIPAIGLEILEEPAESPVVVAQPVPAAMAVAAPTYPEPSGFAFDEPAPKPKKRAAVEDDEDDEEDDRPRRKRRRYEDDEEDEKPRGRKPVAKEKKDKTMMYVVGAAAAVLLFVVLGGFGFWYAVIRKPAVETVDTSILARPKPTVGVVKVKPTNKLAPKDWEYADDVDFQALVPITGKGFGLEKDDGALSKEKSEEFPELGEARIIEKEFAREVIGSVIVFTLKQESLKEVNKNTKRAIATWSDIFLIKIPADEVTTSDFTNAEFKYSGRQYTFKGESGLRYFYRMFVAHDKFYVIRVVGGGISERNEYVKLFFDSFNPTK